MSRGGSATPTASADHLVSSTNQHRDNQFREATADGRPVRYTRLPVASQNVGRESQLAAALTRTTKTRWVFGRRFLRGHKRKKYQFDISKKTAPVFARSCKSDGFIRGISRLWPSPNKKDGHTQNVLSSSGELCTQNRMNR